MNGSLITSFIDGAWALPSVDGPRNQVVNPATEEILASVEHASRDQVLEALDAATRDRSHWGEAPVAHRLALVTRLAANLRERSESLAQAITAEVGMPLHLARAQQVNAAVAAVEDAANYLLSLSGPEHLGNARIERVPAGIVVAITPWNFPLYQAALKIAPAIAAGCVVILKPSEVTPLSTLMFVEAYEDARQELAMEGLETPTGVLQVVLGDGGVGELLVSDARVDLVTLTGSTAAGSAVQRAAAQSVTRVALELGGKSALIVLDGADLDVAVSYGVGRCTINNGQTCAALTRLIVPRKHLAEVEQRVSEKLEALNVGDPVDPSTDLGPLVTQVQQQRVLGYIATGVKEGARIISGGAEPVDRVGWFVCPTALSDTTPDMAIVQEEIFGPVLVIQCYDEPNEAVQLANGTSYGLAAGVIGPNLEAERQVARKLEAGTVFVGPAQPNPQAPFGGVKASGYGRERGPYGVEEFLVLKSYIEAEEAS